ncbi:MAG TPA: hypothetical protein VH482_37925 [Thermomicrobiales bacterium]|jgi:hypothetical protein
MSSALDVIQNSEAPTPPPTRSLANVLRAAFDKGTPLRLIVAKALPDSGQNANAYLNVEIEGVALTVPKVANAGLGGAAGNYPVYVVVADDFVLAVGTVTKTSSAAGPLSGSSLSISGTASIGGDLTMGASADIRCRDLFCRGAALTGSLSVSGSIGGASLDVGSGGIAGGVLTARTGISSSGDINGGGWIQSPQIRTNSDSIRAQANALGFFGRSPIGRPVVSDTGNALDIARSVSQQLENLGLIDFQ